MNYTLRTATTPLILPLILFSLVSATGCSYVPKMKIPRISAFPGVYKIDIQQGNVITQEMIDQLKPGMTKKQVQFVMGTPLVRDTFQQNRWDYVYSLKPGHGERRQESVTLYFEGDKLARFEGDYLPSEAATE